MSLKWEPPCTDQPPPGVIVPGTAELLGDVPMQSWPRSPAACARMLLNRLPPCVEWLFDFDMPF
eukprot:184742-Prymnesium_polylepis.2